MSKKKITQTSLPLSRTTKIMNSAVGVESVDQDIVALATKATELFLMDFAKRAYANSDSNVLEYEDIQRLVHSDPRYDFLMDTAPKKIKFSEALKLIELSKQDEARTQPAEKPIPPQKIEESPDHDQQTSPDRTSQASPDLAPPEAPAEEPQSQSGASESSEAPSSHQDSCVENE